MRWGLVVLFLAISIGGCYLFLMMMPKAEFFTYEKLNEYDHDPNAFTQGLVIDGGFLWESTGRYGESSIRKVDLKTGEVIKKVDLDEKLFGEGLAILNDKLYQLTWKEEKAIVYDRDLNKLKEIPYKGEGWGLTTDGTDLIFSDGSAEIKFLNPETFEVRRSIWVKRKGGLSAGYLNELEYFGGRIYANAYQSDLVYEIHPDTGMITTIIDLGGLWPSGDRPYDGVMNGIAVDPDKPDRLYVTGKLCPKIYEIKLKPRN